MALRFARLDRPSIRRLKSGEKITEHGITGERLANGDLKYSVNVMVDGERIHRVIGRESEGVTRRQAEEFIETKRTEARDSDLSRGFERPQLRRLTDKARAAFQTAPGDRRRTTWVYSEAADFEGLVSNELASFWTPRLSRAFIEAPGPSASPRRGKRQSQEELTGAVQRMHQAGLSYGQIAKNLGISKTKAWRLINDS